MLFPNKSFGSTKLAPSLADITSKRKIRKSAKPEELELLRVLYERRPTSLRAFDQIPMISLDLLSQVKSICPLLAGKAVAFIGDHDGTSLLIGLLASNEIVIAPSKMLLLDFDKRLTIMANDLAHTCGFSSYFTALPYNVFDPIPTHQANKFDWFYTNPPYGSNNNGTSVCLFIDRGRELLKPGIQSRGYLIHASANQRSWARKNSKFIRSRLIKTGWKMSLNRQDTHTYHLDDDPTLISSGYYLYPTTKGWKQKLGTANKQADFSNFPNFYSSDELEEYPRFINSDGSFDYTWEG